MKKLRVTVEPFQGTIPFRILQRGRVLVEGSFSGKCTQLHSRRFRRLNATVETARAFLNTTIERSSLISR